MYLTILEMQEIIEAMRHLQDGDFLTGFDRRIVLVDSNEQPAGTIHADENDGWVYEPGLN